MKFTSLITAGVVLVAAPVSAQTARGGYEIRALSARADMVTGGNVLIQITTPPSAPNAVSITVNGREAKSELGPGKFPDTLVARLEDLQIGKNIIEVGLKGRKPATRLSVVQHLIANNYPGLLDGLIPTAAFADTVSLITHLADCELLEEAFEHSTLPWTDDEKAAVAGEANWRFCARNGTAFPVLRATYCDNTGVPADQVYDARTTSKGARCTYQDNMVNIFGRDPKTGFARRPFDNIGVQYGLKALNDGKITFDQFLDVNRRVGGHDIDGNVIADRTRADPEALRMAFQSGRVNDASQGMAAIPIIDVRPYTDGTGDVHDIVNSHITRARLVAANGTSGNQVLRTYAPGTDIQQVQHDNLDDMEGWLAAIANDNTPAPTPLEKVIRDRPATVTDACYTKEGGKITDMRRCEQMFPLYSNPRLTAGMPMAATMLKCELKPIDRKDYSVSLTAAQFAAIEAAFPAGVLTDAVLVHHPSQIRSVS